MVEVVRFPSDADFRQSLGDEFSEYLAAENLKYERESCLKVDLHVHDRNSDIPDELWGRILGLPETWLKTKKLLKILKKNNCDVVTVTNHNNARSCWELQELGEDVLVAAEFTCHFPEYDLFVHVLTYGFTAEQEIMLNSKRGNVYDFLRFAHQCNVPVVLPHPLYFYTHNEKIDITLFEKLAVMFQRFEVLNGQRDLWQSVMTLNWARGLTAEKIDGYAKKHGLDPAEFGVDPNKAKILTGGSDDHTGIFAGECGSYLYVPNLQEQLKVKSASHLALEALREGRLVPYGHVAENQKLNIALLDYFSQIATKIEDPGLLRILLHRGEARDKVYCFVLANFLLEMKKHKTTKKFFKFIHDALQGKKPSKLVKWKIPKDYKFCISYLEKIADAKAQSPEEFVAVVNQSITELFTHLNKLIIQRVSLSSPLMGIDGLNSFSTEELSKKIEIPSQLSSLFLGDKNKHADMVNLNFSELLDKLSFPVLVSLILTGVALTSTRVLYQNRNFLNEFAESIGENHHQKRALYLTDTLKDKNGVSNSLSGKLAEFQRTNAPVDFLICHADAAPEPHLHVVRPLTSFAAPGYGSQEIRIPDVLQVLRIFYEGGYDRIICSTEGPMALVCLLIKEMFNVPSYFLMHTDWMDFAKQTTSLNRHELDRIRRLLRAFYKRFDGVFVLNSDHGDWLKGYEMELIPERVFLTAHHAKARDPSVLPISKSSLFSDANSTTPIIFVACRLSKEKGIFDLPEIIAKARLSIPDLRVVIAGSGPAEEELKRKLPDALFLGWVDHTEISRCYSGLDLFVFPSRFDTFGNVLLESFTYGMPAVAYNCKGPKDIVQDGLNGFLVDTVSEMSQQIVHYFASPAKQEMMRTQAKQRAEQYLAEPILNQFLCDLGLKENADNYAVKKISVS